MKRREFFKVAGLTSAALLPAASMNLWGASVSNFSGLFYIHIQANGGWDVTSFCDPKTNQPDAKIINNWASTGEIQTSGNLKYAPVAANAKFFTEHAAKTLVINGINSRTNAHTAGRNYNNTGSQKNGAPHLSALYAFEKAQGLAMPLMIKGNIVSGGLIAPTMLGAEAFKLMDVNQAHLTSTAQYLTNDDLATIKMMEESQARNLKLSQYELPKQKKQIDEYYASVFASSSGFSEFPTTYTSLTEGEFTKDSNTDAIKFALSAFKHGLGVSADITIGGFDTHDKHDTKIVAPLTTLTNLLGALWSFAEQLGISDRVLVSVASDFGRTPYYNDALGKDHWPYTSSLIMKTGVTWTNRTVGASDAGHKGHKINPLTLKVDNIAGIEIDPAQVHQGLRQLLGMTGSTSDQKFDLDVGTTVNFFNSAVST